MKKIFLLAFLVLFALSIFLEAQNSSACGPCQSLGNHCGVAKSMGTCRWNEDNMGCEGECGPSCGPGASDWYCAGWNGRSCTTLREVCCQITTYTCRTRTYGDTACDCDETGLGGYYYRQYC
jgi:hypothetical protein